MDRLPDAYQYAAQAASTPKMIIWSYRFLATATDPAGQVVYRTGDAGIINPATGAVIYRLPAAALINSVMAYLLTAVVWLLNADLTHNEVFYFVAQMYLRTAQIHLFAGGNGLMARLLEKWFLSQRLGAVAWYVQSERYYYNRRTGYANNISLGSIYDAVKDEQILSFLLMLPDALRLKMMAGSG